MNSGNFEYAITFAKYLNFAILLTLEPYSTWEGADSALLQIALSITSVRDAAKPQNLVTFLKI